MKNITIVSYYIKRSIEKYSQISSQDEFVDVVMGVLSERLITKQNSAELIYLIYKYPFYVERLVHEMDVGLDDYDDTAIMLYRRILSGASQYDISMSDIFPAARDAWYAPWCDGFLATRPILQKDICTFFCPDTTTVGPFQLLLANQYGNLDPEEEYDFDFDLHIDLDDDNNYEDDESSEEDLSAVALREFCADLGVMYNDIIPCAAAQIIDVVDDALYNSLADELRPLINVYKTRVVCVANWVNRFIHDHIMFQGLDMAKWQIMFDIILNLINENEDAFAFRSPLAKLLFSLYPIFSTDKESSDYKMHMCHNLMIAYTSRRSIIGFSVDTDWDYYGHYPRTLLQYFSGEILLDAVQQSLRNEFGLGGPKSYVLFDEDDLVSRDRDGVFVVSNSPFMPLIDHWSSVYPIFVRANKASQYLARKLLMERDYPYIHYILTPPLGKGCADFSSKGSPYACLHVGGIGYGFEDEGYVRCKDQAAVCMGFALKSVLARGMFYWPDRGLDDDSEGPLAGSNEPEGKDRNLNRRFLKGYRRRDVESGDEPPILKKRPDKGLTLSQALDEMFPDIEDTPVRRLGSSMDDDMIIAMSKLLSTFNKDPSG